MDSLSLKSLSLIEKVYGISARLIWVSARHTASTWNLDIKYCSLLYFQDEEQYPISGGSPFTFSNRRRNESSCFRVSLLLYVSILLNLFLFLKLLK